MPRRNRRVRDDEPPSRGEGVTSNAPAWAQVEGVSVRVVGGQKVYRCPGCDHEIRAGVQHLVVVPDEDPETRRHWHTECWRRELRRLGLAQG